MRFVSGLLFILLAASLRADASSDTAGGWMKYEKNPILGGQYGACFDISVLHDDGKYRMWVSWRPQKSIALVESTDDLNFAGPPRVVLGPAPTGWEDEVNRPVVIRRKAGYRMWYSGGEQYEPNAIGWPYATSITLGGLANLLDDYPAQSVITAPDYLNLLSIYTRSHRLTRADGRSFRGSMKT